MGKQDIYKNSIQSCSRYVNPYDTSNASLKAHKKLSLSKNKDTISSIEEKTLLDQFHQLIKSGNLNSGSKKLRVISLGRTALLILASLPIFIFLKIPNWIFVTKFRPLLKIVKNFSQTILRSILNFQKMQLAKFGPPIKLAFSKLSSALQNGLLFSLKALRQSAQLLLIPVNIISEKLSLLFKNIQDRQLFTKIVSKLGRPLAQLLTYSNVKLNQFNALLMSGVHSLAPLIQMMQRGKALMKPVQVVVEKLISSVGNFGFKINERLKFVEKAVRKAIDAPLEKLREKSRELISKVQNVSEKGVESVKSVAENVYQYVILPPLSLIMPLFKFSQNRERKGSRKQKPPGVVAKRIQVILNKVVLTTERALSVFSKWLKWLYAIVVKVCRLAVQVFHVLVAKLNVFWSFLKIFLYFLIQVPILPFKLLYQKLLESKGIGVGQFKKIHIFRKVSRK